MKKSIYLITSIILIIAFTISCKKENNNPVDNPQDTPTVLDKDQSKLVYSINDFSFELFEEIDKTTKVDENIFFSPYSINSVLYMLLNGANGETKHQLREALELENYQLPQLNEYHKLFYDIITKNHKSENIFLANSFWMKNDFIVENAYQELLKKYYYSEIFSRDFSSPGVIDEVNEWISNHTNNMIQNMIDAFPDNIAALLINAIYFKDNWKIEFDKKKTSQAKFYNSDNSISEVDMMYLSDSTLRSYVDSDIKALELPYSKNSNTKMMIIAPNGKNTISDITDEIDVELLYKINSKLRVNKTELFMPRFKLKTKLNLNNTLQSMGIKDAFSPNRADFSTMSKMPVYISKVLHDAAIEVDETGTQAAAATVAMMLRTSINTDDFILYLNKPFIFLIQDTKTNSVLFIGKVNKL